MLRVRGQPVGMKPDYWSQHPESKKRSVWMFCCTTGSQTSHAKPFQPEPPFTLRARKSVAVVSNPKKEGRGSELESPLKAQCQGIKQTSKFQYSKPTQLQFGKTALEWMSFAGKLLSTAGPNWALVWETSTCSWHSAERRKPMRQEYDSAFHWEQPGILCLLGDMEIF